MCGVGQVGQLGAQTRSHTLGPFQAVIPIGEKFHVSLGYVRLDVSAPKMLESFRAIGFLKVSDAEAPKDVEATLDVFQFGKDGVEVPAEDVRLEELAAGGRLEDEPRCAVADVGFEHGRERRAEVDFAGAVFGFKIMLDLTPLSF
jgi:hypothetical protein